MKHFAFLVVAIAAIVSLVAFNAPAPGHADAADAPFVTEIPNGYRDRQWVSSAHEAGNLNSLGAVLGNDIALKAYREGKLPFPDAQSSLLCITATSHRMRTIRSLANCNLSFPAPRPTSSSWSRTQQSTQQPAGGDSVTSKTADLPTRHS